MQVPSLVDCPIENGLFVSADSAVIAVGFDDGTFSANFGIIYHCLLSTTASNRSKARPKLEEKVQATPSDYWGKYTPNTVGSEVCV